MSKVLTEEERLQLIAGYLERIKELEKRVMDETTTILVHHIDITRCSSKIRDLLIQ